MGSGELHYRPACDFASLDELTSMRAWWMITLLVMLITAGCTGGQPLEKTPAVQPEIIVFTGSTYSCTYKEFVAFVWETRHAERVSLESGYIEDGVFFHSDWYSLGDLPSSGSRDFETPVSNAVARLCITAPESTEPVCAFCNPADSEGCLGRQSLTDTPTTTQPEIVSLTCSTYRCMNTGCVSFGWETRNAERVSLQSGYIEDGVFIPGSWRDDDDLPPNGSSSFRQKINNYAARVCIVDPASAEPVCAFCNPFDSEPSQ